MVRMQNHVREPAVPGSGPLPMMIDAYHTLFPHVFIVEILKLTPSH